MKILKCSDKTYLKLSEKSEYNTMYSKKKIPSCRFNGKKMRSYKNGKVIKKSTIDQKITL